MRCTILVSLLLAACVPVADEAQPEDTGSVAEADTDTDADTSAPAAPPPAAVLSGREVYRQRECPLTGDADTAQIPKGALIQAWACNGPSCWPVPEYLSVERGGAVDEATLSACTGAERFEIAWIAVSG